MTATSASPPNNDGVVIRLSFPALTEERRREYVKLAKHYAEDGRVAVRNIRRDARKHLEGAEKQPRDLLRRARSGREGDGEDHPRARREDRQGPGSQRARAARGVSRRRLSWQTSATSPDEEREPTEGVQIVGDEEPALRFGPDDTGPLPALDGAADRRGAEDPGRGAPRRRRPVVELLGPGPGLARRPERGRRRRPRPHAADRGPARRSIPTPEASCSAPGEPSRPVERPTTATTATGEQARVTPIRTRREAPDPPRARPEPHGVRHRGGGPPAGTCRWPSPSASASPRSSCCS